MTLGPDFVGNKFSRSLKFSCHWDKKGKQCFRIILLQKKTFVTWQFGKHYCLPNQELNVCNIAHFFCLSFPHESKIWENKIISFPEYPDLGCAHLVLPVWHFSVVPPPPVTGRVHSWWRLTWRDDVGEVLKIKLAIFFISVAYLYN